MGLDIYFEKSKPEQIGYFRKVNCLISWMEKNVCSDHICENCQDYRLDQYDFENLLKDVNIVMSRYGKEDFAQVAEVYLPTHDGYFFGDTSYDDEYYHDIRRIAELCRDVLASYDDDYTYTFHAWW